MKNIIIQNSKPEHIPLVSMIEKEAASVFPPGILPEAERQRTVELSLLEEGVKKGLLRVALNIHSQLLGHALVRHLKDIALLAQIDVRPQFMRRGIGTMLAKDAIANLKPYPSLWLTTFKNIPWCAPFYIKLGFKIIPDDQHPESISEILKDEKMRGFQERVAMCIDMETSKNSE